MKCPYCDNNLPTNTEKVVKMKFERKPKIFLISLCILCLISIPLVYLRVLPFIIFPITILVSFVIQSYILFKWLKWKKDLDQQ